MSLKTRPKEKDLVFVNENKSHNFMNFAKSIEIEFLQIFSIGKSLLFLNLSNIPELYVDFYKKTWETILLSRNVFKDFDNKILNFSKVLFLQINVEYFGN